MRITRVVLVGFLGATLLALTPAVGSAQDKADFREYRRRADLQRRRYRGQVRDRLGPGDRRHLRGPNKKLGFQFEYAYR